MSERVRTPTNQGGNARRGGRGGSNVPARGPQERPKKESILNLGKYVDQRVRVKFSGGRESAY